MSPRVVRKTVEDIVSTMYTRRETFRETKWVPLHMVLHSVHLDGQLAMKREREAPGPLRLAAVHGAVKALAS